MTNYEAIKTLSPKQFAGVMFPLIKNDLKTEEELLERLEAECSEQLKEELRLQETQLMEN